MPMKSDGTFRGIQRPVAASGNCLGPSTVRQQLPEVGHNLEVASRSIHFAPNLSLMEARAGKLIDSTVFYYYVFLL